MKISFYREDDKMRYKKIFENSFIRFALVGILNTIIGTAAMLISYHFLKMGYWLSSAMNYIVGSIFSYFANKYFTFQSKKQSLIEIGKFILNISICYVLAYGCAKKLTEWLFMEIFSVGLEKSIIEQIAMLIGMGLFIIINYIGQKTFVFKK